MTKSSELLGSKSPPPGPPPPTPWERSVDSESSRSLSSLRGGPIAAEYGICLMHSKTTALSFGQFSRFVVLPISSRSTFEDEQKKRCEVAGGGLGEGRVVSGLLLSLSWVKAYSEWVSE